MKAIGKRLFNLCSVSHVRAQSQPTSSFGGDNQVIREPVVEVSNINQLESSSDSTRTQPRENKNQNPIIVNDTVTAERSRIKPTLPETKQNDLDELPHGTVEASTLDSSAEKDTEDGGVGEDQNEATVSESQRKLTNAIKEFEAYYQQIAGKDLFTTDRNDILGAISIAEKEADLRSSSRIFGKEISNVLRNVKEKHELSKTKSSFRMSGFLSDFYTLTRRTLQLTSTIAQGTYLPPLKVVADGLGIILQIMNDENNRTADFLSYLDRIEFQATRIYINCPFDVMSDSGRNLVEEKGVDLMIAIIAFFRSALQYFSLTFPGKLTKTICKGSEIYDDGKKALQLAIEEYNQAIIDRSYSHHSEMCSDEKLSRLQRKKEDFVKWLSPVYELVEAHLYAAQTERAENTLQWLCKMKQFQDWHSDDGLPAQNRTVLWISGGPGVGKSTMAGCFIESLKRLYPDSIVAYFFCKSECDQLRDVGNILRTLAYQCAENSEVRSALENLRLRPINIKQKVGIKMLSKWLLEEPLRKAKKKVYVIIDGLDEIDDTILDDVIETRPQIDILVKCLANLPTSRVMFIGRPTSDVQRIVPNAITKVITVGDNKADIQTYVEGMINRSDRLKERFKTRGIDPVQYFLRNANGMFLWVVLVIRQLEQVTSRLAFEKGLTSFSQASGDMDRLYSTVLARIGPIDRKWVLGVLQWLVACKRRMSVEELKSAVEWKEEIADFNKALKIRCGSIVRLIRSRRKSLDVQLIHGTFRTFLSGSKDLTQWYSIMDETVHAHVALRCLNLLSSPAIKKNKLDSYALQFWAYHLSRSAKTGRQYVENLVSLHKFFRSEGIKKWIRYLVDNRPRPYGFLKLSIEKRYLEPIREWLKESRNSSLEALIDDVSKDAENKMLVNESREWALVAVQKRSFLGELIGKAAINMWIREQFGKFSRIEDFFWLSLQYYWRRDDAPKNRHLELEHLMATDFSDMVIWADNQSTRKVMSRNLGVVFFELRNLDKCISCFELAKKAGSDTDDWINKYLAKAYEMRGDYEEAVKIYEHELLRDCDDCRHCGIVYKISKWYGEKHEYDRAIEIFKKAINRNHNDTSIWMMLSRAYQQKGDLDNAIGTLVEAIELYLVEFHTCEFPEVLEICKEIGNYDMVIKTLQKISAMSPSEYCVLEMLGDAYEASGDRDKAIETFKFAVETFPTEDLALRGLGIAYVVSSGRHESQFVSQTGVCDV